MTPETFNWNKFQHSIIVDSEIENVFPHIATSQGIAGWFIGKCSYTNGDHVRDDIEAGQKDDKYFWEWQNKDLSLSGEIIESEAPHLFSFTFSPLYIVTIRLTKDGRRTKVTLTHEYSPDAEKDEFNFLNCCVCWAFFLTNLKSVIENKKDLRETVSQDESLVNR
jgi:uncharacterized protein YndB with AHSA1/START domain